MKIAQIQGTVTLCRSIPEFRGASLKLVAPLSADEVRQKSLPSADTVVAWDQFGAGFGQLVAMSDGREAAQPFHPDVKPVDVYVAAILDRIDIEPGAD